MTQEQIHANLDNMLANPKSKNFLNHLVRAYMPVSNVEKVWNTPTGDFKCVLTREQLFSAQDIMDGIQTEEFKSKFMDNLKSMFDENAKTTNPIAELVGDKKMGLTGKDTTTFMTVEAFQTFCDWVITKALKAPFAPPTKAPNRGFFKSLLIFFMYCTFSFFIRFCSLK